MSWRIIHFEEEGTIEAVPTSWIRSANECYWPPLSGLKLRNSISKCIIPANDWKVFKSRQIGGVYGDLATARLKAMQAEDTSDLQSDTDNEKRRIVCKNRKYQEFISNASSEEESYDERNDLVCNMPIMVHRKGSFPKENIPSQMIETDLSVFKRAASKSSSSINQIAKIPEDQVTSQTAAEDLGGQNCGEAAKENYSVFSVVNELISITYTNPIHQDARLTSVPSSEISTKDDQFKRQVLRNLSILNFKLDQIMDDISRLNMAQKIPEELPESIFKKFHFPLSSEEELHKLENFIENEQNNETVVLELSRIGGHNLKIMTRRLLEKVLSDNIAMNYSLCSLTINKHIFFCKFIKTFFLDAVMKIHSKATAADVESTIKQCLVKAKERYEKKK